MLVGTGESYHSTKDARQRSVDLRRASFVSPLRNPKLTQPLLGLGAKGGFCGKLGRGLEIGAGLLRATKICEDQAAPVQQAG